MVNTCISIVLKLLNVSWNLIPLQCNIIILGHRNDIEKYSEDSSLRSESQQFETSVVAPHCSLREWMVNSHWKMNYQINTDDCCNFFMYKAKEKLANHPHTATAIIQLISYDDDVHSFSMMQSGELLKYIRLDTINFNIRIITEDPNRKRRSELTCETMKCDENGNMDEFRFVVANVKHPMVVRLTHFSFQGVDWYLSVSKNKKKQLFLRLEPNRIWTKFSCQMNLAAESISTKSIKKSIEKIVRRNFLYGRNCAVGETVWIGKKIRWKQFHYHISK